MAFRVINKNDYGIEEFSMDLLTDLDLLPKRGLITGSIASVFDVPSGKLISFWFTASTLKNTDGHWDKL